MIELVVQMNGTINVLSVNERATQTGRQSTTTYVDNSSDSSFVVTVVNEM